MTSDEELVRRIVTRPQLWARNQTRRAAVAQTFAVGSTSAKGLCIRFDLDPDETRSGWTKRQLAARAQEAPQ